MWEMSQDKVSLDFDYLSDCQRSEDDDDFDNDDDLAIATMLSSSLSTGTSRKEDGSGKQQRTGKKKKKKHRPNSLDHLKQQVSDLLNMFEECGIFIPPPSDKGESKVWSNRNYGQDKKKQRKATEKMFLERRIAQLEACLASSNKEEQCDVKRLSKK